MRWRFLLNILGVWLFFFGLILYYIFRKAKADVITQRDFRLDW
jgi:hypothetical protein